MQQEPLIPAPAAFFYIVLVMNFLYYSDVCVCIREPCALRYHHHNLIAFLQQVLIKQFFQHKIRRSSSNIPYAGEVGEPFSLRDMYTQPGYFLIYLKAEIFRRKVRQEISDLINIDVVFSPPGLSTSVNRKERCFCPAGGYPV